MARPPAAHTEVMVELSPSRSALARSTPVRAVVGMAMVVVGVLALWQQWLGGYDVTSTYGSLGGGWWLVLVMMGAVVALVVTGLVVLALHFLGFRRTVGRVAPAVLVACLTTGFGGAYAGSLQHAEDQRVSSTSCNDGVRAQMDALADEVRPEDAVYLARPTGTPRGCRVDLTIPRDVSDPFEYVDQRSAGAGFRRTGDTTWADGTGLEVTMRVDRTEEAGKREVFVILTGRRTG